jgi:hypothetical protein
LWRRPRPKLGCGAKEIRIKKWYVVVRTVVNVGI